MNDEFKFKVYIEDPEDVLLRVFGHLQLGQHSGALSACCEYQAAKNAQCHVDAALATYKEHLARGGGK